jgi:hypothetical protein
VHLGHFKGEEWRKMAQLAQIWVPIDATQTFCYRSQWLGGAEVGEKWLFV